MGVHEIDGVLWITNARDGISKFTYQKEDNKYISEPILEEDKIFTSRHSTADKNGIIWISAFSGIKGFDTKTEKLIYNLDSRYDLAKMDEPIYETDDFFFTPTDNSFLKINKNQKLYTLYDLTLTSIEVANKPKNTNKSLTLSPNERNIKFDWNSIYFGEYDQLSYYTKLDGWDDDWVYQGAKHSVFYPHLPYGDFEFKVKVEGPRLSEIKTLNTFTIDRPWWKTKAFLSLLIGTLALCLYLLYRWRMNVAISKSKTDKKIAELELKALRAQLNPHFIFNSLNSIKRLIQKNENPLAIEYLLLFSSMIRNVLDLSDKQEITLAEELVFTEQYLKMEKLRFDERFDYNIEIDENIDIDNLKVPPMILQPHIENSLWHGIMPLLDKKGCLTLKVSKEDQHINISINDNGIGRKASAKINEENKDYKHNAKGSSLSIDRIKLNSLIRQNDIKVSIVDKEVNGESDGTDVIIQISNSNL